MAKKLQGQLQDGGILDLYKERMAQLEDGDDAQKVLEEKQVKIYGIKPQDFFKTIDKEREFLDKMKKVNKSYVQEQP